jgi:hypothetical protein
MYAGIAPKASPPIPRLPSKQRLFHRIRYHFQGNAEGSTLRLTLGCLLSQQLSLSLRRVGSGRRLTFASGEQLLSEWMDKNAFVTWIVHPEPWVLEKELIHLVSLPLNLDMNRAHPFHIIPFQPYDLRRSSLPGLCLFSPVLNCRQAINVSHPSRDPGNRLRYWQAICIVIDKRSKRFTVIYNACGTIGTFMNDVRGSLMLGDESEPEADDLSWGDDQGFGLTDTDLQVMTAMGLDPRRLNHRRRSGSLSAVLG